MIPVVPQVTVIKSASIALVYTALVVVTAAYGAIVDIIAFTCRNDFASVLFQMTRALVGVAATTILTFTPTIIIGATAHVLCLP